MIDNREYIYIKTGTDMKNDLSIIARLKGKTMTEIVRDLVSQYIEAERPTLERYHNERTSSKDTAD